MENRRSRTNEIAKIAWNLLKKGSLGAADGIVDLSLMRKGTRPRPGTRASWPEGTRDSLYGEQNGLCVYCRVKLSPNYREDATRPESHIDHVIPVVRGGTNCRENLQLLCARCNLKKSDRTDVEFRYRFRSLLPQQQGILPKRLIKQSEFDRVAKDTPDAESYRRFKAGKYLTPAQKVNSGSLATAVVIALAIFLPIYMAVTPDDASTLLVASAATGVTAGLGVWIRARYTGKHRVD